MPKSVFAYFLRKYVDAEVFRCAGGNEGLRPIDLTVVAHHIDGEDVELEDDIIELWMYVSGETFPAEELSKPEGIALLRRCDASFLEDVEDPLYEKAHFYQIPLSNDPGVMLLWLDALNKDESRIFVVSAESTPAACASK